MRGLFVTATDTGVGKSVLSACLLASMRAHGERVGAFKPAVTGLQEPEPVAAGGIAWPADHELLGQAAGLEPQKVAPLRFGPAVSPHLAAELAGERIDPDFLLQRARAAGDGRTLVIEGVGGLLVPLCPDFAVRDLARALGLPLVIAARPGLGTINHTLLSLEAARSVGLRVSAVVLTPWPARPSVLERSNRATIGGLGGVEVHGLAPLPGPEPAALRDAGSTLPWQRWL